MKYKFMNPFNLVDKKNVRRLLKKCLMQEYSGDVTEVALSEELLMNYLQRIIDRRKDEFDIAKLKEMIQVETEPLDKQNLLNHCINELEMVLNSKENYYGDLISVILLGLLYVNPSNDIFKGEADKANVKNIEPKELEAVKEEIRSAWRRKSNDNKINKVVARKNYPIPVVDVQYAEDEPEIISIPGGCLDYHKTMISKENIGLFDNMTQSASFSKYSFPKAYDIYEQLKNSQIENLILMEYSIGMGYVNKVYPHVSKINKYKDLQSIIRFVKKGTQITPFYIRDKIVNALWKYLDSDIFDKQSIQNACVVIDYVSSIVNTIFVETLQVWWYFYYLKSNLFFTYEMRLHLEAYWKEYFNNQSAHEDWINYCGIHNWKNITRVEDCFTRIEETESFVDSWLYKSQLRISDIEENTCCLLVNTPINDIGNAIIRQCEERMRNKITLPDEKELYQEFEMLKREIFREMRQEEEKLFYKKDIKVSNDMKRIKVSHVYAILTKEVIEQLIGV